jgi:hypothetical protein
VADTDVADMRTVETLGELTELVEAPPYQPAGNRLICVQ